MSSIRVHLEYLDGVWRIRSVTTFEYLQLKGKHSSPAWTTDISAATRYGSEMSAKHSVNAHGLKVTD